MKWLRIAIVLLVLAALLAGAHLLHAERYLLAFVSWIRGAGWPGIFVYAVVYILACVLFLPGSVLTLGAGFSYGVGIGVALVWTAATIGACLAFILGRTLLRSYVESRVARNERFAAIDRAVRVNGFRIVLLTRLSPVFPFNLLNYAFGLTAVNFRDYALATAIGILPGTAMYIYLGSLATDLADIGAGHVQTQSARIFYYGGLVFTVVVTLVITRIARRALNEATQGSITAAA